MKTAALLDSDITQLGLSGDFCERCATMNLRTLRAILQLSPGELVQLKGFSYHWLEELSGYLSRHGLLSLLQALPGNNVT